MLNQNQGYTCACTLDNELNADNHTCRGKFARETRKNAKSLEYINTCCISKKIRILILTLIIFLSKHQSIISENKQHLLIVDGSTFINYYHGLLGKPKTINIPRSFMAVAGIMSDPLSGISELLFYQKYFTRH